MGIPSHLFELMKHVFWGFAIAFGFGVFGGVLIWVLDGEVALRAFLAAYFLSFNCLVSGGLIAGTAIFVFLTQGNVPSQIEATFTADQLAATDYRKQRERYLSPRRSITFATDFIIVAFIIFYLCRFPLGETATELMIFAGCVQYSLGVYVGRKLFYIAQMLHAVSKIEISEDIFKSNELAYIVSYVNVLSTLTVVFVYANVTAYYGGPFRFDSPLGPAVKIVLLLPAVLATPVLAIFNFYPRVVLRELYSKSISLAIDRLTANLRNQDLSTFERMSYLIDYDKMSRDELRYRLTVSLSDLPFAVTVFVMILGIVLKT